MHFYPEETKRIEDAQLVLMGINPSELDSMSLQLRADVLAIRSAQQSLQNGKMPS